MSEKNKIPILFQYIPELQQNLPWKSLGQFPTPIRKLDGLGYNNLWIKQDNLSSNVYGGNTKRPGTCPGLAALE
jgi:D-cysteine desulfhydrase